MYFGKTLSASDINLSNIVPNTTEFNTDSIKLDAQGNLLWEYRNKGTINSIPVDKADLDLQIDSDDIINQVFYLERNKKSVMLWFDVNNQEDYNNLLDRENRFEIYIETEDKQYDADKHGYWVWIKYYELKYRLNNRYEHLRGDTYV